MTLKRGIKVSPVIIDSLGRNMTTKLKNVVTNYRYGLMSKKQAKTRSGKIIDDEFNTLLRVSRDQVRFKIGYVGKLPPEELARLKRWRDTYKRGFMKIIRDVK